MHQGDPRWRIGQNGITRNDIILVGVVHVSSGSWMPIIQLNRLFVFLGNVVTLASFAVVIELHQPLLDLLISISSLLLSDISL
jgi:hypothetical protein